MWQSEHCNSFGFACTTLTSSSSTERKQWLHRCGKLRESRTETSGFVANSVVPPLIGVRANRPRPRPASCSMLIVPGRSAGSHKGSDGVSGDGDSARGTTSSTVVGEAVSVEGSAAVRCADVSFARLLDFSSAQSLNMVSVTRRSRAPRDGATRPTSYSLHYNSGLIIVVFHQYSILHSRAVAFRPPFSLSFSLAGSKLRCRLLLHIAAVGTGLLIA